MLNMTEEMKLVLSMFAVCIVVALFITWINTSMEHATKQRCERAWKRGDTIAVLIANPDCKL